MDCIAMGRSMPAWEAGEYQSIRANLAASAERLARSGADFFACPDNTAHLALEQPGDPLPLPGLARGATRSPWSAPKSRYWSPRPAPRCRFWIPRAC